MSASEHGKCGSKGSPVCSCRTAGQNTVASAPTTRSPFAHCSGASPQSVRVLTTSGHGKTHAMETTDLWETAIRLPRSTKLALPGPRIATTRRALRQIATHRSQAVCACRSPNPTPSLRGQACIARMLSRRMRFITKSPLSSTSSKRSIRTLVFAAGKNLVLCAALEPIPATWSRRQLLTPYSGLHFGDALCGAG